MSDVIGRGVIELSAESSKLHASISDAKDKLKGLGEAAKDSTSKASASIDKYIQGLERHNATLGKSAAAAALYKLQLKGATEEQLKAAEAALKVQEAFAKHTERMEKLKEFSKEAYLSIAALVGLAGGASIEKIFELSKAAGEFEELAQKVGGSAEKFASLAVAAKQGNIAMSTVAEMSVRLNKNLAGTDDSSTEAGQAIADLGLKLSDLKGKDPADQMEILAKQFAKFGESTDKSTTAVRLMGKTAADAMPFLHVLGEEGARQNILTNEQIQLAFEFTDKQAKANAQIALHAQAIATKLLPAIASIAAAFAEMAKNEAVVEAVTKTLQVGIAGGLIVFQTLAVLGSDVAFVFRTMGREAIGFKDALVALGHGEVKKALSIFDNVGIASEADRKKLDAFQAQIMSIDATKLFDTEPKAKEHEGEKRKLHASIVNPSAAAEAKARADLQAEIIKKATEQELNTYANADKILASRRAASLIDERDYFEAKSELIRLDADAQKRGLAAEIAVYEKVNVKGQAGLAVQRKIADLRGALAKLDENQAIALDLNDADRAASVRKITEAYNDAAAAAKSYIDTISRQSARDLAGIGQGKQFRDEQSGRGAIEDRLISSKEALDTQLRNKTITGDQYTKYLALAQDTYSKEAAAFADRTAKIKKAAADGFNGMTEALHNYADESKDIAAQTEHAFSGALSGLEDSLVAFATTGKSTFKDLLHSIQADIVRIGFKSLIGKGIDALMGSGGASGAIGGAASAISGGGAAAAQAAQAAALTASTSALALETAAVTGASIGLEALTAAAASASVALETMAASSAAGAAGSGGGMGGALAALFEDGARALGGPVSPGGLYRVNEKGPELLSVAGKQYLMMGPQGGSVTPNGGGGGGGQQPISVNINQTFAPNTDRTTINQAASRSGMEARRALARIS